MDAEQNVSDAIREQVAPTAVDALSAIDDPLERAQAALAAIQAANGLRGKLARVRQNALLEMNAGGMTWAEIGEALGTSGPRAHQIAHGRVR